MPVHENQSTGRRFLISIGVTVAILALEVIGGYWTGSLALLSDAAHVFMDVFALALSYFALRLSALPADDRHTYGFHRLEVLAALINGVSLGAVAIGIFAEAWERWQNPQPVKTAEMLLIAALGLIANLIVVFVLRGGQAHGAHNHRHEGHEHAGFAEDLNLRSALLHVIGDAVSSGGVILAAILIRFTGSTWLDPLVSALIGILILVSSWRVLRSSLHILIEGVPEGLSLNEIGRSLAGAPGVQDVHDLHVWNLCSGHVALSAHVVIADQGLGQMQVLLDDLKSRLRAGFGVEHTTIQFELAGYGQGRSICDTACANHNHELPNV